MKLIHIVLLILLISTFATTACSNNANNTLTNTNTSSDIFFPQQKDDNGNVKADVMEALLVGELVLVDNCLRLNDPDGNSYLLIWPTTFELVTTGTTIQVNNNHQSVAQIGDNLEISGGEVPEDAITDYVNQPLPTICNGPYWIIGSDFSKLQTSI